MSKRNGVTVTALLSFFAVLLTTLPASAVTSGIALTNGDMELPGPTGTKVVAFDATGVPFAPNAPVVTLSSGQLGGGIPGWTFTGGSGIAATGEINLGLGNSTFGDGLPGDSGTEGAGNPGNEMLLSTLDGKVFQTSSFMFTSAPAVPTAQKLRLSFDARNIFTPNGVPQLTARLYYVDGSSNRQTLGTPLVISALPGGATNFAVELRGDVPADVTALNAALNRPIGVEFDTTSRESDPTVTESWAGIDNVLLQITGVKRGDFNGDGQINNTDYLILRDNLQEAHTYEFEGELNGDYVVDLDDFRIFKNLFLTQGAGASGEVLGGANVPEPSSILLVSIAIAGFAGAMLRRSRFVLRSAKPWPIAAAAVSITLGAASLSSAALKAYDPFNDTPVTGVYTDGALAGQNPTIGPASPSFFRDPWTLGTAGQVVQPTGLAYLGAPAIGGSVNGTGRTERYLTDAWTATTVGTYYMSFQINFGSTTGALGYRAFEMYPPDVVPDENRIGDIGYNQFNGTLGPAQQNSATAKIQFNLSGSRIVEGGPDSYSQDGLTHLIVLKFVLSATNDADSVSLFLDPQTLAEPVVPSSSVANFNMTLGAIGSASLGGGDGPSTVFDELRVGDSFVDVMPPLPKPGDTNGDGFVDLQDYQAIISHMNLAAQPLANGDVTGDGRVTIADYRFWKDRRTDLGGAGGGASVPEPSATILLLIGAMLCSFLTARISFQRN